MGDARLGAWNRVLIYLGLVQPPDGIRGIIPWWLVVAVSALILMGAVVSLASGSIVLGVAELIVAPVVAWNGLTRRRRQ